MKIIKKWIHIKRKVKSNKEKLLSSSLFKNWKYKNLTVKYILFKFIFFAAIENHSQNEKENRELGDRYYWGNPRLCLNCCRFYSRWRVCPRDYKEKLQHSLLFPKFKIIWMKFDINILSFNLRQKKKKLWYLSISASLHASIFTQRI